MDILRAFKHRSQNVEVVGFISAVCVLIVSFITPLVLELSTGGGVDGISQMIGMSLMVVVFLSYLVAMFVPAIWLGSSRGWKAGVSVIVFEIIWLTIIAILSIGFLLDQLDNITGY